MPKAQNHWRGDYRINALCAQLSKRKAGKQGSVEQDKTIYKNSYITIGYQLFYQIGVGTAADATKKEAAVCIVHELMSLISDFNDLHSKITAISSLVQTH